MCSFEMESLALSHQDHQDQYNTGITDIMIVSFPKASYGTVPTTSSRRSRSPKTDPQLPSSEEENMQRQRREEKQLKTNIFYHISNPIVRWKANKTHLPLKMILQLLKMAALVVQVRRANHGAHCVLYILVYAELVSIDQFLFIQVILLIEDPVSDYSNFRRETQDVFSNLLCQPTANIEPKIRGTPYNIYTYYLYKASDLEYIFDEVDNLVCWADQT